MSGPDNADSKQRLMDDLLKYVDPGRYDGSWCWDCLIGQLDQKSPVVKAYVDLAGESLKERYEDETYNVPWLASKAYGVSEAVVTDIFLTASHRPYVNDLGAALGMARKYLGLADTPAQERNDDLR